jgi:caffeoyl-CoA O-methyltransferase
MSSRTLSLNDTIHEYLLAANRPLPPLWQALREETQQMPMGGMQISAEQGHFLRFLVEILGAKKVLEVGVFTGYSALAVASALPPDGLLIACDVSDEWTSIGRRYWQEAGIAPRIDLRLAPALETLDALLAEGHAGTFDFAFIDADKTSYDAYYERILQLLRPGGVLSVDNVLWGGRTADETDQSEDTVALRKLNLKIRDDARVSMVMLPIGDGLTLAMKRS